MELYKLSNSRTSGEETMSYMPSIETKDSIDKEYNKDPRFQIKLKFMGGNTEKEFDVKLF